MQQFNPDTRSQSSEQLRIVTIHPIEKGGERKQPGSTVLFKNWSLILCFLLPTILSALYFGLVAANRYESESKFVVRTPLSSAAGQLTSMFQGSKVVRSTDDAYIVHAYLKSQGALRDLVAEVPLREIFGRASRDFPWSYPPPFRSDTVQRLYKHFLRFIYVHFDQTTGISTLRVQAFRPEDAVTIATALLHNAERLINRLNDRVQRDSVANTRKEVGIKEKMAIRKQGDLTEFRMQYSLVDPIKMSEAALETIAKLSLQAALARAQLSELRKSASQSSQIKILLLRIQALEEQIRNEQQKLAGDVGSLAPRIAEFERLVLFREFAERSYASAMTSFQLARSDAQRQKLYLEQISLPVVADHHQYPYRILSILLVAVIGFALHVIVRQAVASN